MKIYCLFEKYTTENQLLIGTFTNMDSAVDWFESEKAKNYNKLVLVKTDSEIPTYRKILCILKKYVHNVNPDIVFTKTHTIQYN